MAYGWNPAREAVEDICGDYEVAAFRRAMEKKKARETEIAEQKSDKPVEPKGKGA